MSIETEAQPSPEWSSGPMSAAATSRFRAVTNEPHIDKLKVVSGGARFWAGAMAGNSNVVMKLRIIEKPSGTLIAEPEFYQRAAAMSGAWTFGAQDKDMLHRIVVLTNVYLARLQGGGRRSDRLRSAVTGQAA